MKRFGSYRTYKLFTIVFVLFLFIFNGCGREKRDYYHQFPGQVWNRFDILTFRIPITKPGGPYDIIFYAHHTKQYEFDNLNFHMIMNTPSGEERIGEFPFAIKKSGSFLGTWEGDSCEVSIPLKTDMIFNKTGELTIEIETIVPRPEIKGLLGVGIRLQRSGQ